MQRVVVSEKDMTATERGNISDARSEAVRREKMRAESAWNPVETQLKKNLSDDYPIGHAKHDLMRESIGGARDFLKDVAIGKIKRTNASRRSGFMFSDTAQGKGAFAIPRIAGLHEVLCFLGFELKFGTYSLSKPASDTRFQLAIAAMTRVLEGAAGEDKHASVVQLAVRSRIHSAHSAILNKQAIQEDKARAASVVQTAVQKRLSAEDEAKRRAMEEKQRAAMAEAERRRTVEREIEGKIRSIQSKLEDAWLAVERRLESNPVSVLRKALDAFRDLLATTYGLEVVAPPSPLSPAASFSLSSGHLSTPRNKIIKKTYLPFAQADGAMDLLCLIGFREQHDSYVLDARAVSATAAEQLAALVERVESGMPGRPRIGLQGGGGDGPGGRQGKARSAVPVPRKTANTVSMGSTASPDDTTTETVSFSRTRKGNTTLPGATFQSQGEHFTDTFLADGGAGGGEDDARPRSPARTSPSALLKRPVDVAAQQYTMYPEDASFDVRTHMQPDVNGTYREAWFRNASASAKDNTRLHDMYKTDLGTDPRAAEQRRVEVRRMLRAGQLTSPQDYYYASLLFFKGERQGDMDDACVLSLKCVELHPVRKDARQMYAASKDRLLVSRGDAQLFGACVKRDQNGGYWFPTGLDGRVGDDVRDQWGVTRLDRRKGTRRLDREVGRKDTPGMRNRVGWRS